MYFGKIKGTDEWFFDVLPNNFEAYKEIDDDTHKKIIQRANNEQKLISADSEGNPVLVDLPEPTEKEKAERRINELETYLSSTDWYAIRYADTGESIPEEIKEKRQSAREEISHLRELL